MSASENFLKYFLEKRKKYETFFYLKFHFFQSVSEILNYQLQTTCKCIKFERKKSKINLPYSVHLHNTLYTLQK